MEQYPDSISIVVAASASQNASGNFTEGASSGYTFDCRAEINASGRRIAGADGVLIDYSFICYMPRTTTLIPIGSDFALNSAVNGVIEGKVRGASNGQLNSRLWL